MSANQRDTEILIKDHYGKVPVPQHKKADGTFVPTGESNPLPTQLTGSYVRLSTEAKPTEADGVKDGNDLLEIDTKKVFVFYQGEWREI